MAAPANTFRTSPEVCSNPPALPPIQLPICCKIVPITKVQNHPVVIPDNPSVKILFNIFIRISPALFFKYNTPFTLYKEQKYFYTKAKVTIEHHPESRNLMFRMWGKIFKQNRMLNDTVITVDNDLNRTRKVYQALEEICYEFDLSKPLWLESNKQDFIRNSKTRFTKDSFIEDIAFDYLEIQVIEE